MLEQPECYLLRWRLVSANISFPAVWTLRSHEQTTVVLVACNHRITRSDGCQRGSLQGEAPSRGRLRRGGGSGEGKSASWRDCRALMICDASLQSETLILTPTVEILTVSLSLVRECMRQARTLTRIHLHCLPLTPVVLSWSDFIAFIDEFTIQLVRLILEQDSCVPLQWCCQN